MVELHTHRIPTNDDENMVPKNVPYHGVIASGVEEVWKLEELVFS